MEWKDKAGLKPHFGGPVAGVVDAAAATFGFDALATLI